jgi:hypothetical protein
MRAVTMRTGALGRLELITRVPGYDSFAAASARQQVSGGAASVSGLAGGAGRG